VAAAIGHVETSPFEYYRGRIEYPPTGPVTLGTLRQWSIIKSLTLIKAIMT
jgi:hypothetical protein